MSYLYNILNVKFQGQQQLNDKNSNTFISLENSIINNAATTGTINNNNNKIDNTVISSIENI